MERKPLVPLPDKTKHKLRNMKSWVILARRPEENAFIGYVEQSFHMEWSNEYVLIHISTWWKEDEIKKEFEDIKKKHPSWGENIWLYEVHDENLPIVIDFEAWLDANAHNPNTFSGVTNKYKARNAPFKMKED